MKFLKLKQFLVLILTFSGCVWADDLNPSIKKDGFMGSYLTLCMQNISNIEKFREKLNNLNLPKLDSEKSKFFLRDMSGDAWPLPENGTTGNLILAIPRQKNSCFIYARRVNQSEVEIQFKKLVANAPKPFVASLRDDSERETGSNGRTHALSYVWSAPGVSRKILFFITTTAFENANLQAMASVSIIDD